MLVWRVFAGVFLALMAASAASGQTASTLQPTASQADASASEVINPLSTRAQVAPVLRFLQAKGVKLTSLGVEGGLAAYLGESPNSQMQIFYVAPDGEHVLAGLMFDTEGNNITGVQLGEMQRRFEAAQRQLGKAPPTAPGGAPAVTAEPAPAEALAPAISVNQGRTPAEAGASGTQAVTPATGSSAILSPPSNSGPAAPVGVPRSVSEAQDILAAPAAKSVPSLPPASERHASSEPVAAAAQPASTASAAKYVSSLDRGAVERALEKAAWFRVGVENAPTIYMVADPQCAYCHAAWGRLRDLVWGKKLQIRVVMIAGLKGSLPKAISIMARDPGKAWLSGEGSTDLTEVQPPPAEGTREYADAQQYLDKNAGFVRQFGITQTPTLLYVGKDNRLYSSIGLPEDAGSFLSALN